MTNHSTPTPVIWLHSSSVVGAEIFNPNFWDRGSKALVQSCWSEYSVLHYCAGQIAAICAGADGRFASQVESLRAQWRATPFPVKEMIFFAEEPDLHLRIEAFFCGMKSLLDLLAQLLTTEKIVSCNLDGFHRDKDIFGGKVVNALSNNAVKAKKDVAYEVGLLISDHKKSWIDQAINARDLLVHPSRGAQQLMFRLDIVETNGSIECRGTYPPMVGAVSIPEYANASLQNIAQFSTAFLTLLRTSS